MGRPQIKVAMEIAGRVTACGAMEIAGRATACGAMEIVGRATACGAVGTLVLKHGLTGGFG